MKIYIVVKLYYDYHENLRAFANEDDANLFAGKQDASDGYWFVVEGIELEANNE